MIFVLQALHDYKENEMNADEKLKEYLNIMVKNSVCNILYTEFLGVLKHKIFLQI